ncbi:MAG: KpsF/GutQ family sugar-phosphate isomerase [Alistipes sp.]|nr:KpsF/GutQ family sugar-phosphate isomerase [Alistipes sp.]
MNSSKREDMLDIARETLQIEADALLRIKHDLGEEFVEAVEAILACNGKVIMTGMGKSGLVAKKIAATLASTGTPSFYLHPGEAFHGDLGMISKEDVIVALSYSGETDEVLKIVPFIHENGNTLISMTGKKESALAKNSNIHLDVAVEREACILHLAPTSSTTAQLALGDALACALMKARSFSSMDYARLHPGGTLGRRLLMTVGNVMRRHDLPIVSEEATATEMIHAISKGGLGLIVVMRGEEILGIVTDGDIRRAMESRQAGFFDIHPMDIASRTPKSISPTEKLIEAEKMMTQHKVNSLLVVNDEKHLIGVIQIYDIKL